MPKKTVEQLNRIYDDAEEMDKELFAEQRSNILLVAGEHYNRISNRLWHSIRHTSRSDISEKKLRLTKNHMHKVQRSYKTSILAEAPGVTVLPQSDTDLQDRKDADLNKAVWENVKLKHKFKKKVHDWASNFTTIGEVCTKIFWDDEAGPLKGYEQALDDEGNPRFEEGPIDPMTGMPTQGEPIPNKDSPVFMGDFVFEPVFGFNLLVEAGTEDMDERNRAFIVRKMVDIKKLKRKYAVDEDKIKGITETAKQTYIVFDVHKGTYQKKRGQALVKEYYWRPSKDYPEGWFIYATDSVVLEEGPLPGGLFPLCWAAFDKHPTSPRGRSILKVARPYQAEINRASSAMATHQVTMGDDKLIYSSGAKLAPGALLPGVRGISMTGGQPPTILAGRNGAQYVDYVNSQISEMYDVLEMAQNQPMNQNGQIDPYALLFKSASQKRIYSPYINAFEQFLVDVAELTLSLGRIFLPDDALINATGKREIINIQEYRDTSPLCYHIKVEPQSETAETLMGRQLTYQHLLQYVGKQLDPKTIGKVMKNMPYANSEDTLDELLIDDENAENDMLALERGEQVQATEHSDPDYMLKRLTHRMKKSDFRYLEPNVQQGYQALTDQYDEIILKRAEAAMAAKNEFIPVDGALVTVDVYVEDPKNPENQAKRAKVPQRAVEWLIERMKQQGATTDKLEEMNEKSLNELAKRGQAQQQQPQGPGPQGPQAGMPPQFG